jgi:hypothetical protein
MNVNAKYVMGSIVGLALLFSGSFASPASAKISVAPNGAMRTNSQNNGNMTKNGFSTFTGFLRTKVTVNLQPKIWGKSGTIVPAQNPNNTNLANWRLDIQNPPSGYTNLQVQEGGGTFATVLVPRTLANFSTNPISRAAQQKELMRNVKYALWLSGRSTVQAAGFTYKPTQYKLTGSFSN